MGLTSVYTSIVLERLVVGADSSNLVLELVGVHKSHVSTWVFLAVFLVNSFLVYRGLVRVVALG